MTENMAEAKTPIIKPHIEHTEFCTFTMTHAGCRCKCHRQVIDKIGRELQKKVLKKEPNYRVGGD